MNLKYSILWFDDTVEFYESLDRTPLLDAIAEWGFDPQFKFVSSPEDFMQHEPFNDFDLIVVDYNLEAHEKHGSEFIKKIRDHQVFTEVVFYSSNQASDLWDAIRVHLLEGVFVANRRNVLQKIQQVAEHSVHKILDIENMRGIVMAEVGDIDKMLDGIITSAFALMTAEQTAQIYEKFHINCLSQDEKRKSKLDLFIQKPAVEEMIVLSDSSKRWDNFNRIRKNLPPLRAIEFGDYSSEILSPRNFLAHGVPTATAGANVSFAFNGKSYNFDHNEGISLRKSISTYKRKLVEAMELLSKLAAAE